MTAARKLCKGEFQVQTNSEFRATANKANNGPSNPIQNVHPLQLVIVIVLQQTAADSTVNTAAAAAVHQTAAKSRHLSFN